MDKVMGRAALWGCVLGLTLLLAIAPGCKSKKPAPLQTDTMSDDTTGSGFETTTTGEGLPDLEAERLINTLFEEWLKPIYFDFDSYALRPDARATLKDNAESIKKVPNVIVQIEGHCDERGTQEYNLALGERRALATREYLINLGVSGDRIITISYGEEDPVDFGHNEAAWAKNRRCEFNRAR